MSGSAAAPARADHLSPRAAEVASLASQGMNTKQIARRLRITYETVTWFLRDIRSQQRATGEGRLALTEDVRKRIDDEVSAGRRCSVCRLLLPCFDHERTQK